MNSRELNRIAIEAERRNKTEKRDMEEQRKRELYERAVAIFYKLRQIMPQKAHDAALNGQFSIIAYRYAIGVGDYDMAIIGESVMELLTDWCRENNFTFTIEVDGAIPGEKSSTSYYGRIDWKNST